LISLYASTINLHIDEKYDIMESKKEMKPLGFILFTNELASLLKKLTKLKFLRKKSLYRYG